MMRCSVLLVAACSVGLTAQPLATVQVLRNPQGPVVPRDFIGLSVQQSIALADFGSPTAPNTVLFKLIQNLGNGTLRIGGSAADSACWNGEPAPAPGICQYTLTSADFDSWAYAGAQTGWPMIIGVSLAQNKAAGAPQYILDEVTQGLLPSLAKRPRASLLALELGNELNLYYLNPAYRPPSYGVPQQTSDLLSYISAFNGNAATQNIPLVAPAYANPNLNSITTQLEPLVSNLLTCSTCSPQNLGLVTLHEYFLAYTSPTGALQQLLSPTLMQQVQANFLKAVTDLWNLYGMQVQIDETNSSAPDPGLQGVSDVQASALWTLDYALSMARIGVRRLNFHIHNGSYYDPLVITPGGNGIFSNQVQPQYYAMYAFNAAKSQQFLPLAVTSSANVRAYALSQCPTCAITIFLVNKDMSASGPVQISLSAPATTASYLELSAPSLTSQASSVLFGGVQFNNSTGSLTGPPQAVAIQPDSNGTYTVQLDNAAAGILTIQP